ncbi:unnamed protein product [Phytophthora fragariaefolia]|uniref:Unnamed protein product n=1 Tax=Phytophthora fragariaefolia TaxID=1490495 RepID=A0A9W6XJ55_9STRA|nr:unnamed protein product [Phytophthora fragariaefolia]
MATQAFRGLHFILSRASPAPEDTAGMGRPTRQSNAAPQLATIESRLGEVAEEKFSRRTRSRKPKSPLRLSDRLRSRNGSTPSANPRSSPPTGGRGGARKQQKRKRDTSPPTRQEGEGSDGETREGNGVFFRSAWAEVIGDSSKRRMLQRLFEPPPELALQPQSSTAESVDGCDSNGTNGSSDKSGEAPARENVSKSTSDKEVELAADEETDDIICQLQVDTHQDMSAVVHALYYCSGDVSMARAFLKGASPPGMWSLEDDLLVVRLAEENITPTAINAAVVRGDFRSMQVVRDTETILKRVQFLR